VPGGHLVDFVHRAHGIDVAARLVHKSTDKGPATGLNWGSGPHRLELLLEG
jgi:hypothetical protein